ncbi:hypothetical protein [Pseudodesulfovibrio sp. zrk46]|uniref:c-type cytochrome n=1 Tax=Pseudodesulfovibrio sp. zrk46 TaxID=2725288 RepID=UPI0014494E81|nr:hypothetical protein [Pseudodesulfovibrio sp. zrk46]QJB57878.1 hypothetical protein HFN16_16375 [Pseudodesulfovibrio sp. zrk46]
MSPYLPIVCFVVTLTFFCSESLLAKSKQDPINPKEVLAKADIENGKSIFEKGAPLVGAHLPFQGGPHWLRSQGGSCSTCHGPKGLGNIEPDFCFLTTPPISYKYLAGSGYPFNARQDGSHPAYTELTLKRLLETGYKPNGIEVDYCMPRWRLSDKIFNDLLGYLISLDESR